MEYAEGGSLYDCLLIFSCLLCWFVIRFCVTVLHNSDFNYSTPQAMYWLYQCSKGVEYLHKMRIVHRDLKSPKYVVLSLCFVTTIFDTLICIKIL